MIEPRGLHDQRRPADELGAQERDQARAGAPGRAGAGHVCDLLAQVALDHHRELGQCPVEQLDHGVVGALLRTIDMAGALRSEERVGDVTRDQHLDRPPARVHAPAVDVVKLHERGPAAR